MVRLIESGNLNSRTIRSWCLVASSTRLSSSFISRVNSAASDSVSNGSTSSPLSPSRINSGLPPRLDAIQAKPAAPASINVLLIPS